MIGLNHPSSKANVPFTVLVVDSDTRTLDLAASHIEHWIPEATVIKERSHAEATNGLAHRKADVIVLDCDGPQSDWVDFISELSRLHLDRKVVLVGRSKNRVIPFRGESSNFISR